MQKINIALAGAGGYGGSYLNWLENNIDPDFYILTGVIDPFATQASRYEWLKSNNIPIYDTLENFYADNSADLMIISSPIRFHKPQSITAMANGSHVLCEKPLVPIIQDAIELKQAQEKYNKKLGVGFQLSYSKPILDLKADIIKGEFGKPLELKSYTSWRRFDDYYKESDWKGCVRDKNGEWVLDAVSTNATAHYLFNIFFIAGDKLEKSAMPKEAQAEIYRAKDIKSYDTCFLRGTFDNGCKFYYFASHSGDRDLNPSFLYKFENATVTMNKEQTWNYEIIAEYNDGRVKNYGNAMNDENSVLKITSMMAAVHGDYSKLTCDVDTVMPHIIISNAIFDQAEFINFPENICYRSEDNPGTFVQNLVDDSTRCYESMKMPSEMGYKWAQSAPTELMLEGYSEFSGERFK